MVFSTCLRTECQWKAVPSYYGSGSTVHRYFQEWAQLGVFGELWKGMLRRYDARRGIAWRWQSLDGAQTKAPLGEEHTQCRRGCRARRWVVERIHSWLNRYRRILVRWEKKAVNYIGLLHLVFAHVLWRNTGVVG